MMKHMWHKQTVVVDLSRGSIKCGVGPVEDFGRCQTSTVNFPDARPFGFPKLQFLHPTQLQSLSTLRTQISNVLRRMNTRVSQ